jgi:hypothetical protein
VCCALKRGREDYKERVINNCRGNIRRGRVLEERGRECLKEEKNTIVRKEGGEGG